MNPITAQQEASLHEAVIEFSEKLDSIFTKEIARKAIKDEVLGQLHKTIMEKVEAYWLKENKEQREYEIEVKKELGIG